ncbi:hypothetical protein [Mycoplasmoides alvi]|uniref:hypothetical protein n=1 Tax=Mycoplasmoides alvi TaxID=78580 RepID=UPI0012EB2866|nr:hypothetical protein [Mycoplasmoides alvi]
MLHNFVNTIPYLIFNKYDRIYIKDENLKVGWSHLVNQLLLNQKKFKGSISFNDEWIYGNSRNKIKKKLKLKIRLLSDELFNNFKNKTNDDIFNQLIASSLNKIKKSKKNTIYNIFSISNFQKINIANKILNELVIYHKNRLQIFSQIFKELNQKFFNVKQINERYFISLSYELNQSINKLSNFKNDLLILWNKISFFLDKELNLQRKCDEYSLINQLKWNNEKINEIKYDFKYGDRTYFLNIFLKKIKKKVKQNQSDFITKYSSSRKLIKNWKKSLIHDLLYLWWQSICSFKNKKTFVFYKINQYKIYNLIVFSKYLKNLIYLDPSEISIAISEAKNIVENYYQNFYFSFQESTNSYKSLINFQDIYYQYKKKLNKNIFYESTKTHYFILKLFINNASKLSQYAKTDALLRYEYSKNKFFLKKVKENKSNFFLFKSFNESLEFKNALFFIRNEYKLVLKKLIKRYESVAKKTKNINNFYFVKSQIYYLTFFSKELNSLDNYLNNWTWTKSIQFLSLFLNFLFMKYYEYSEAKAKDFLWSKKEELVDFNLSEENCSSSTDLQNFYKFLNLNKIKLWSDEIKKFLSNTTLPKNEYKNYKNVNFSNLNKIGIWNKLNKLLENKKNIQKNINNFMHDYLFYWKANSQNRNKQISNLNVNLKKFDKIGNQLLKNINIANNEAYKCNWFKNEFLDNKFVCELLKSNNYILNILNKLLAYFKNPNFLQWNKNKKKKIFYKYYAIENLNNWFKSVQLDFFILYSDYKKIDNLSFLKLYLLNEFLYKPLLFIISDLSINDKNSFNIIKGLLLKQQNREGFAYIFLDKNNLSQELSMKAL